MKILVKLLLSLIFICNFSCSKDDFFVDQVPPSDEMNLDNSAARKAPVFNDIIFEEKGFSSSVFYDGIKGPDGIHLFNKNKLLVAKEFGGDVGIYLAKRGTQWDTGDAFSTLNLPFDSPDDIVADDAGIIYVADGQANTVFKLNKNGGSPVAFVTTASTGSDFFNPFGVAIAPTGFDGPNVDPGDLIVCDNAYGVQDYWAVWAVNRSTGAAKVIAGGTSFNKGPVKAAFNSEGTLYVSLNKKELDDGTCYNKIVTLTSDGQVSPFKDEIYAPFFAIHPLTDNIYYKMFKLDDPYNCDNDAEGVGEIWRMTKDGKWPALFASNVGITRAGTQDMVFNEQGTTLFMSHRNEGKVIEIYGKKHNW